MSRPQRYANAAMSDEVVVIKETAEVLADAVISVVDAAPEAVKEAAAKVAAAEEDATEAVQSTKKLIAKKWKDARSKGAQAAIAKLAPPAGATSDDAADCHEPSSGLGLRFAFFCAGTRSNR